MRLITDVLVRAGVLRRWLQTMLCKVCSQPCVWLSWSLGQMVPFTGTWGRAVAKVSRAGNLGCLPVAVALCFQLKWSQPQPLSGEQPDSCG